MRTILKLAASFTTFLGANVHAHPGHGEAAPTHWHASDACGLGLGLAVAAAAFWLARRK